MEKSEKKNLVSGILNTILPIAKTAVSGLNPLIGMAVGAADGVVKAVKTEKEKNLATQTGGEGKTNWVMLAGQIFSYGIVAYLIYLIVSGAISIDQAKEIFKFSESVM